jgi:ligand-binding sensor domain-containing protein/serine phosphatase RsbU (regulator of sigma subunit)
MKWGIKAILSVYLLASCGLVYGQNLLVNSRKNRAQAQEPPGARSATAAPGGAFAPDLFRQLTVENGLAHNHVQCVLQDRQGFLWIGTQAGLDRYDGYAFTSFRHNPKQPGSLPDNRVLCLLEDQEKRLWVGTANGLARLDPTSQTFEVFQHKKADSASLLDNQVFALHENRGQLWIGTGRGISRLNPASGQFFNYPLSGRMAEVRSLASDPRGNIVAASLGRGVLVYRAASNRFETYPLYPKRLGAEYITRLFLDQQRNLWVGSLQGLRRIYPDGKVRTYAHDPGRPTSLSDNYVTSIAQDAAGNLWVSTRNGISVLTPPELLRDQPDFTVLRSDPQNPRTLSVNHAQTLAPDKAGLMWVGTNGGGLNFYDPAQEKFKAYRASATLPNHLGHAPVTSIGQDGPGNVWLGTQGGLYRWQRAANQWTHFAHRPGDKNSLAHSSVTCVLNTRQGNLLVGTVAGLSRLTPGNRAASRFIHYSSNDSELSDSYITCLFEAQNGQVWIGTREGGLYALDLASETIITFRNNPKLPYSLSDNTVQAITQDEGGYLWVGTGMGLNRLDLETGHFTVFQHEPGNPQSLAQNSVKSLYAAPQGILWVGTHGGLQKMNTDNLKFLAQYQTKDGLPSNSILGILADDEGDLWLSTNQGLAHLQVGEGIFQHYDEYDNLQANDFWPGAAYRNPNGEMFFGGRGGFNLFHPSRMVANPLPAQPYLARLEASSRDRAAAAVPLPNLLADPSSPPEVVLEYDQNSLHFHFVGLSLRHPEKNEYRFFLEGYETTWGLPTPERQAYYANLPPGRYTFWLRASNSDGVWNDQPLGLRVRVKPPFWLTWWFLSLAAVFLGSVILAFYKWRTWRIKKQNQLLTEQVAERTREITHQRDELDRAYNSIKAISQIGRELTSELHRDEVVTAAFQKVSRFMEVSMFRIGIFNPDSKMLSFTGFAGQQRIKPYSHDTTDPIKRLSVICFQYQMEILIKDFDQEAPEYVGKEYMHYQPHRPGSAIYLPLLIDGQPVGVITVQTFRKHAYTPEHAYLLRALASYVSVAIDNANNYSKLTEANLTIERRNESILSSIRYAEKIQQAILPDQATLQAAGPQHFVLHEAKDIVSGDFYWATRINYGTGMLGDELLQRPDLKAKLAQALPPSVLTPRSSTFWAVVDCTGHGVPGAFMSIVGSTLLNDIILRKGITEPAAILEELHLGVRQALQQDDRVNDDGMDVCICRLDQGGGLHKLTFAGAKRPLFIVRKDYTLHHDPTVAVSQFSSQSARLSLMEYKGNKKSVGGRQKEEQRNYQQQEIQLLPDDMIYLTSDGFVDQNDPQKEKFSTPRLKNLLLAVAELPMAEQKAQLLRTLRDFQQREPQRDDVTIVGIRA